MWTASDTGTLVNFSAVRSVDIEISDDRQWVEVQVRWAGSGERYALISLIVQDYGDVRTTVAEAGKIVDAVRQRIIDDGEFLPLPRPQPPTEPKGEAEPAADAGG